jgi:hypothetical protein
MACLLLAIGFATLVYAQGIFNPPMFFPTPPAVGACTANTQGGGTYSNVIGLWHFDGNYTDNSSNGRTGTPVGGTATSTAQKQYGSASLLIAASSSLTIPAGINLGTGNFTLEAWLYYNSAPGTGGWLSDGSGAITFGASTSNFSTQVGLFGAGATTAATWTWTPLTGAWHHHAIVRNGSTGNNVSYYLDGSALTIATNNLPFTTTVGNGSAAWNVGNGYSTNNPSYIFPGYIDELRISNMARYTANFSPSTVFANGAFCNS